MKNRLIASLQLFTFLVLSSCGGSRKTAVIEEHILMEPVVVSAKNNPLDIYRVSDSRPWDIFHTSIALHFDLPGRTANGRVRIKLHPYFYPSDSIVLDAKTMEIDTVALISPFGKQALAFTHSDELLRIKLDKTYTRFDTAELFISYRSMPYQTISGGSAAIRDDRGLYFINTNNEVSGKPVQIWTQGETEANSHWFPTFDQPNERFTVDLQITIPDTFTSLSNGELVQSRPAGEGLRTDYWNMPDPIQPYAVMMAIGKFSVVKDVSWNGKEVSYYVEQEYAPYARKIFNNTPEMIDYFSGITGVPYPWNKYSQVIVRDYVSGAMENTTASLFGEFMNQNFREISDKNYEDIVSHELFHQWFGNYVTTESWTHLTVNESFANYGEQLWRNHKYGPVSRDELALYDLNLYLNQTRQNDEPLVRFHYHAHEDMFDRISYQKGGAILRYLHGLIGDSAFYRAMNLYLRNNALQAAEATHWRLAVEEATGQDWNWFFNQWYLRGGHPILELIHHYDDEAQVLTVQVTQSPSDSLRSYRLPLRAALITDEEYKELDWLVDQKHQTFEYRYLNGKRPVFVPDTEHWLPGRIIERKGLESWLLQLSGAKSYISRHRAVGAAFSSRKDSLAPAVFRAALRDTMGGIRAYAASLLKKVDKDVYAPVFTGDLRMMAVSDADHRARASAFEVLGVWKVAAAKPEIVNATADLSYMVAGAALGSVHALDADTAYLIARQVLEQDARAELQSAAWKILASKGRSDDINYFDEVANRTYGTRKVALAGYLYEYYLNTDDTAGARRTAALIEQMAANESIKPYRYGKGSNLISLRKELQHRQKETRDAATKRVIEAKQTLLDEYIERLLQSETDSGNLRQYRELGG